MVSTVEEEVSRITGDQDLNSAQTMSDRHSLCEILERKVESVVQGKMQLREDYLKLRLIWSAKIRNKEVQKSLHTDLIENLSVRDCNFTSRIIG